MVRLSLLIQSNDRGSGLKTALPDRFSGLQKKSFGGCSSTMRPSSMKIIRCATRLAKFNSCVTQIMLIPSLASATIVSRTSLIISGSSDDVGSSNSIRRGCIHSARAIATRLLLAGPHGNLSGWSYRIMFTSMRRRKSVY